MQQKNNESEQIKKDENNNVQVDIEDQILRKGDVEIQQYSEKISIQQEQLNNAELENKQLLEQIQLLQESLQKQQQMVLNQQNEFYEKLNQSEKEIESERQLNKILLQNEKSRADNAEEKVMKINQKYDQINVQMEQYKTNEKIIQPVSAAQSVPIDYQEQFNELQQKRITQYEQELINERKSNEDKNRERNVQYEQIQKQQEFEIKRMKEENYNQKQEYERLIFEQEIKLNQINEQENLMRINRVKEQFDQQKLELKNKHDRLEQQIKNLNETIQQYQQSEKIINQEKLIQNQAIKQQKEQSIIEKEQNEQRLQQIIEETQSWKDNAKQREQEIRIEKDQNVELLKILNETQQTLQKQQQIQNEEEKRLKQEKDVLIKDIEEERKLISNERQQVEQIIQSTLNQVKDLFNQLEQVGNEIIILKQNQINNRNIDVQNNNLIKYTSPPSILLLLSKLKSSQPQQLTQSDSSQYLHQQHTQQYSLHQSNLHINRLIQFIQPLNEVLNSSSSSIYSQFKILQDLDTNNKMDKKENINKNVDNNEDNQSIKYLEQIQISSQLKQQLERNESQLNKTKSELNDLKIQYQEIAEERNSNEYEIEQLRNQINKKDFLINQFEQQKFQQQQQYEKLEIEQENKIRENKLNEERKEMEIQRKERIKIREIEELNQIVEQLKNADILLRIEKDRLEEQIKQEKQEKFLIENKYYENEGKIKYFEIELFKQQQQQKNDQQYQYVKSNFYQHHMNGDQSQTLILQQQITELKDEIKKLNQFQSSSQQQHIQQLNDIINKSKIEKESIERQLSFEKHKMQINEVEKDRQLEFEKNKVYQQQKRIEQLEVEIRDLIIKQTQMEIKIKTYNIQQERMKENENDKRNVNIQNEQNQFIENQKLKHDKYKLQFDEQDRKLAEYQRNDFELKQKIQLLVQTIDEERSKKRKLQHEISEYEKNKIQRDIQFDSLYQRMNQNQQNENELIQQTNKECQYLKSQLSKLNIQIKEYETKLLSIQNEIDSNQRKCNFEHIPKLSLLKQQIEELRAILESERYHFRSEIDQLHYELRRKDLNLIQQSFQPK